MSTAWFLIVVCSMVSYALLFGEVDFKSFFLGFSSGGLITAFGLVWLLDNVKKSRVTKNQNPKT